MNEKKWMKIVLLFIFIASDYDGNPDSYINESFSTHWTHI